ncbi:MAG: ankyrin repeat domain-containing protein [Bryobacterales bacterium]|nr:ankyrin repeat domain-containing protein [Bryobacterales bacterium]
MRLQAALSIVLASSLSCAQAPDPTGLLADENAVNEQGNTPLCDLIDKAIRRSPDDYPLPDAAMVRELLERGVDPNISCANGISPLTMAAMGGETFMIEALLDHGADVEFRDDAHNLTPHGWCYMSSSYDGIELMESRGAPVDDRIKNAQANVGVYFDTFSKLLDELPEGLTLAERAQYEYDSSLSAQKDALKLLANDWDKYTQILMLNQAKGRKYDPDSGMDPREWRWHTRLKAMTDGMKEMYNPSMLDFGPQNLPPLE